MKKEEKKGYLCLKCRIAKPNQYYKRLIHHNKLYCFLFKKPRYETEIYCIICGKIKTNMPDTPPGLSEYIPFFVSNKNK